MDLQQDNLFLVDQAQPGIPAYQYSLNNGLSYQSSNIFTALLEIAHMML